MKKYLLVTVLAVFAGHAYADNNNVGCGWGSMVFDGKSDKPSQILAATTNGTFGNQTFGISSGTAGCAKNATVKSYAEVSTFMTANIDKVAHDMAVGKGESLNTLASLMGMSSDDKVVFSKMVKKNFSSIFPNTKTTSEQALNSLSELMSKDARLAHYTA